MGDNIDKAGLYSNEIDAPETKNVDKPQTAPSRVFMSQTPTNNISSDAYNVVDEKIEQKSAGESSESNENLNNTPLMQPDSDSIKKLEEHHLAIKKINITNLILGIIFFILIGVLLGVIYLWK